MDRHRTVLLVEDNKHLNKINSRALRLAGYRVLTALTVREARAQLAAEIPDAIVLDILLPDGNGVDFCREIREFITAPILFLTSVAGVDQALEGLRAGGDDYLNKPFHIELLLARIEAFWRRDELQERIKFTDTLVCGPLILNTVSGAACLHGKDMLLTSKEFAVLLLLVRKRGCTLTAGQIYQAVWNQPMAGDANAVRVAVSRLRGKLAGSGFGIAVRRGEGYCFGQADE